MPTPPITLPPSKVYGSPVDDPTLQLRYWEFLPDPSVFGAGPYPAVGFLHAGGFVNGGPEQNLAQVPDFLAIGCYCLIYECRLAKGPGGGGPGLPGQTTDGKFAQQTDDVATFIRWARAQSFCIGFVGGVGGSGSGHHTAYKTLIGTVNDDLFDAGIALSPVMDMSDRATDTEGGGFVDLCTFYARTTDLTVLRAQSPIAAVHNGQNPLYHSNGTMESMPFTQFTLFRDACAGAGVTNYLGRINTVPNRHSFATWSENSPIAVPWMTARINDWLANNGGGTTPPPPIQNGREHVTVRITGMSASTPMNLFVQCKDKTTGLVGPVGQYPFISDRDSSQGGISAAPEGNYVLIPSPGGLPDDITGKPWLAFDYVNGSRYPITWGQVNPAFGVYNFDPIDAYLAVCSSSSKLAGISISAGLDTPAWVYTRHVNAFPVTSPVVGTIPLPWDVDYLKLWKAFILAFANKYRGNTTISYVLLSGFGQGATSFLCSDADFNAMTMRAQQAGYADLASGWTDAAQQITSYWFKAMKGTRAFLALDYPVPADQGGLNVLSTFVQFAQAGYKTQFGVMSNQLLGSTDDSGDLDAIIVGAHGTSPTGYEFEFPASDSHCDPTQTMGYDAELGLRNTANAGIGNGAFFLEYFESDILITTAPYPADFATFQTALHTNAH